MMSNRMNPKSEMAAVASSSKRGGGVLDTLRNNLRPVMSVPSEIYACYCAFHLGFGLVLSLTVC